jgi:Ser/Thr protein kinase RdoA (MazF antagonist)
MTLSLARKALSYYSVGKPIKFERASAGISTTVWLVTTKDEKKYALRIYAPGSKRKDILLEVNAMRMFHRHGMPVPEVIAYRRGQFLLSLKDSGRVPVLCVLTEFIDGRHLSLQDTRILPEVASIQAALHNLAFKKLSRRRRNNNPLRGALFYLDQLLFKAIPILAMLGIDQKVKALVAKIKSYAHAHQRMIAQLRTAPVHLDYDSDNILIAGGKISGVIDFSDIQHAAIVADLGNTLWWILSDKHKTKAIKQAMRYLKCYTVVRKLPRCDIQFLIFFVQLRNVFLLLLSYAERGVVSRRRYLEHEEIVNRIDIFSSKLNSHNEIKMLKMSRE